VDPEELALAVPGMTPAAPLCMFCYLRPKNASLIHGRIGHQVGQHLFRFFSTDFSRSIS
jgi:hypothetical protein